MRECRTKRKENGRESTIVQNRESTGQVWETLGEENAYGN